MVGYRKWLQTRLQALAQLQVSDSPMQRYGFAVIGVISALVIELLLRDLFIGIPFLLFWIPITLSAWYGGIVPALMASFLTIIVVNYFFQTQNQGFSFDITSVVELAVFSLVALFISVFAERRRHTERQLEESEELLRVTLSSIGDGVITTDDNGKVTFLNPEAVELTGWNLTEAAGQDIATVFRIVNETTRQPVESPIIKALEKGVVVGLANHTVLLSKDGREISINDSGAPIKDDKGKMVGAVLVFQDITDQRVSEVALREKEQRLQLAIRTARMVAWEWDIIRDRVTTTNNVGEIYGVSSVEYAQQGFSMLHPDDRAAHEAIVNAAVAFGQEYHSIFRVIRPDNQQVIWIEERGLILREEGRAVKLIGIVQDITERKQTELRIIALQEITAALSAAPTMQDVATVIVDNGLAAVGAHHGVLGLLMDDKQTVELIRSSGMRQEIFDQYRHVSMDLSGPMTDSIREGAPVWIESQAAYIERYPQYADIVQNITKSQGAAGLPLMVRGQAIGALHISFPEPRKLAGADKEFLMAIAAYCAQAIDRTQLHQAEQQARLRAEEAADRLSRLHVVTKALSPALMVEQVARVIIDAGTEVLGAITGTFQLLVDERSTFEMIYMTGGRLDAAEQAKWRRYPANPALPATQVVLTRQPFWFETGREAGEQFPALASLSEQQPGGAALIPLLIGDEAVGVVTFVFAEPRSFTDDDRAFMRSLAHQCGQALERARLYEANQAALKASERARERLAYLAHASAVLSSSLDYQTTLTNIANLSIPTIADWCRIDIVNKDGEVKMVAVSHHDPERAAWFFTVQERYPPKPETPDGIMQAFKTGQAVFIPKLEDSVLVSVAYNDEHLRILRELEFKSIMFVPLTVRGESHGVVTFVASESGRLFTDDDLALAQEVAHRAAVAIENTRLYRQAQEAATIEERQRLARELHDAVTQTLFSAATTAEVLSRMWDRQPPELIRERLHQLADLVRGAQAEMRTLLMELKPERLTSVPLSELLNQLVQGVRGRKVLKISVELEGEMELSLPENVHLALYRIAQEGLNNIVKHSYAKEVIVRYSRQPSKAVLQIVDDGRGFDSETPASGLGLLMMRERAEGIGATLTVSSVDSQGTKLEVIWQTQADGA